MRVNEVKQTKTIKELVRIEYIAEDGIVFRSEEECKKYEESALFAISKELKRLDNKKNGASEYDIYDECAFCGYIRENLMSLITPNVEKAE